MNLGKSTITAGILVLKSSVSWISCDIWTRSYICVVPKIHPAIHSISTRSIVAGRESPDIALACVIAQHNRRSLVIDIEGVLSKPGVAGRSRGPTICTIEFQAHQSHRFFSCAICEEEYLVTRRG